MGGEEEDAVEKEQNRNVSTVIPKRTGEPIDSPSLMDCNTVGGCVLWLATRDVELVSVKLMCMHLYRRR